MIGSDSGILTIFFGEGGASGVNFAPRPRQPAIVDGETPHP